ncbi:hypothetical protein AVEN_215908-1, partial [Araneus ventricosus]
TNPACQFKPVNLRDSYSVLELPSRAKSKNKTIAHSTGASAQALP